MHGLWNITKGAMVAAVALAAAHAPCAADPLEDFYKGKTVTVLIGYSAGGGYDLYGRLLARHFGRFIPGNPTVTPQNMPGAGSLKSASYLANVAAPDGTVIATFSRAMPIYPLLFKADYDGTSLKYVGSITTDTSVCLTWNTSAIKTWDDLMSKPSNFGGEGKGSDPDAFATLLAQEFGAKIKLVTGYPGTADITLAMERGELDGLCGISYSTLKSAHADWISGGKINLLVQAALDKDPAMPNVPLLLAQAVTEKQKQVGKLAVGPQTMARPFAAPPATPPERLEALRRAFDRMVADKDFLDDAKKANLDVNPLTGEAMQDLVKGLYQTPPDVVKEAAAALGGG